MAFPFVFGGEAAFAAVMGEGADEGSAVAVFAATSSLG